MATIKQRLQGNDKRRAEIASLLSHGVPQPSKPVSRLQQQLDALARLRVRIHPSIHPSICYVVSSI
jgi:hypothetical protein